MATIRLMIWSRSDVNNVWIKSGGGGERKNERERKWRKKVFYRGLNRDERGAVISRAPNIFCAHLAPRVPPAKKISSFFLFFISASTSGNGHERTKRQSEQSS